MQHVQTVRQLVNRDEFIRLVGLRDRAGTAQDNIHSQRLEYAGLGAERNQIRIIHAGQFGNHLSGFIFRCRFQPRNLSHDFGGDAGIRIDALHSWQQIVLDIGLQLFVDKGAIGGLNRAHFPINRSLVCDDIMGNPAMQRAGIYGGPWRGKAAVVRRTCFQVFGQFQQARHIAHGVFDRIDPLIGQ